MTVFSQRKIINLLLFFALIILCLSSSLAYLQIQRLIDANAWVTHTYKVIEDVDQTLYIMNKTEKEIARYLLTHNKIEIQQTSKNFDDIHHHLSNLMLLTKDNPFQNAKIKRLLPLMMNKINFLSQSLHEDHPNNQKSINIFASSATTTLTKQISELIYQITTEEKILLDMRNDYSTAIAKRSSVVLISAGILNVCLFLISILLLNYYLRKKDLIENKQLETQKELDIKNKRLEIVSERYNLAAMGSKTGVWDWKVGTEKVYYSPVLIKMLGYNKDEFPSFLSSFKNHIHPDDYKRVLNLIDQHLKDQKILLDMELRLKNKNGQYSWYRMVGKAIRDKHNKPLRMVGSLVDISARKEVEMMKNEFVSTVSHELRTPLTSIHGAISLLIMDGMKDATDDTKELLFIAQNNSERLIRLINDILDMEKMESGRIKFNLSRLELNAVLNEALLANQPYAEKFNVKLKLINIFPHLYVNMDRDRFIQVLTNLISNAIKYSPAHEYVSIDVNLKDNNTVRISVIDKGPGIPEEFKSKIFQKFSQADSSSTRKKEGTGLGLNIAKMMIEKMGGSIGFVTNPNNGTAFFIDIPLMNNTSKHEDTSPTATSSSITSSYHILYVEDDKDLVKIIKTSMTDEAEIINAPTLKNAAIALTQQKYDLAILDLQLPDGNATELLPLLHQKNIPIIIFSAYECPQEYIGYVNIFLTKSRTSITELVSAVRKIIISKKTSAESGKNWQARGILRH